MPTKNTAGVITMLNVRWNMTNLLAMLASIATSLLRWPRSNLVTSKPQPYSPNYQHSGRKWQRLHPWWWLSPNQPSLVQPCPVTVQDSAFVPSLLLLFQRYFPCLMVSTYRCRGERDEDDLDWSSSLPYAVALRLSDESTRTSSQRETVPVPSHDAHHRPFDRAVCFLDRLLSSGSPGPLMNAGERECSTSPLRASLGICGCAAVVLHSICFSCSGIVDDAAAAVKGLTARWGSQFSKGRC